MGSFAGARSTPATGQSGQWMDESRPFVTSGGGVGRFPGSVVESVTDPIRSPPIADPTPVVEILRCWDQHSQHPLVADFSDVAPERGPPRPFTP
jgi:hypothetical protein